MAQSFSAKLDTAVARNNSLLCVGLDPDLARIPADFLPDAPPLARMRAFCLHIIEQTSDVACCYKPNSAFFEQFGAEGLAALQTVIAAVPHDIPVLLDAKRGDIGNTAHAYARAAFEALGADAVTLSPYLGRDSVVPFLAHAGKTAFLLCHTSNPSAAEVQHYGVEPLYRHIARVGQTWGAADQIAFVVGATQPQALAEVRALAPQAWILAPGIGAQGGDLEAALAAGLNAAGSGLLVPVSRAVIYAADPHTAALELRDAINALRAQRPARRDLTKARLIHALFEAGCVKFGNFTLASGKQSPIYIDLRRMVSYPALLRQAATAYAELARALHFDCIAAVPYAALPVAAATALTLDRPMIYPRKEVKAHGTGQAIEGDFAPGQTALVIEDVITTGGSIIMAIETLAGVGLIARDVLVLVDREQGGAATLAEGGCTLHAVLIIAEILDELLTAQRIDAAMYATVKAYLS